MAKYTMNTPNKLTILRIIMIPFFVLFFEMGTWKYSYLLAFAVFALASFTDWLDGHLARKNNLISDFGKFMDPLADKILVTAALVCFVGRGMTTAPIVIVILAREFLVTSLRLIAANKGIVIAADRWGKYKTATTMIWICFGLLSMQAGASGWVDDGGFVMLLGIYYLLMALSLFFTVFSGFNYIWKNRGLLADVVTKK